ncbi:MAG: ABC-2 transporter permease [Bacilli bacterium]|nr:ABC-2 transporter permease [Bacilli bacterium]
MKSLLYKEFRLAMHPLCYIFALVFPLMLLIPNFPLFVGTLYIIPGFAILFLGANKGKQSNDLFYSALLPIRKRDIVFARMMSVMAMELITLIMMGVMYPLKLVIEANMGPTSPFTTEGIMSGFAFALVGYAFVNAVYFLMFYKSGRSVTAPTLIGTFGYVIYILVFTSILPAVNPDNHNEPLVPGFYDAFVRMDISIQIVYLVVAFVLYLIANYFVYKKASQELERADL